MAPDAMSTRLSGDLGTRPAIRHEATLGGSVRYWRLRRGLSQAQLADRAGVSITVVRKLEQEGDQTGSPHGVRLGTLYSLARALHVQTAQLFPSVGPGPADQDPVQMALLPVRVALTPPLPAADPISKHRAQPELRGLRFALFQCARLYDQDQYDQVAARLPGLLEAALDAVPSGDDGPARSETLRIRSGVYQLAGWFLAQVGAHDLAYQAIRDAMADSRSCGDPLTAAACVICECWLFIRQGRLLDAKRTAAGTADFVEPRRMKEATPEALSVWGWLLLLAGAAAVRNNQEDEAREFLRLAATAAAGTARDQMRYEHYWSVLGPATVTMREAEHEVITGNYRKALRLAEQMLSQRVMRADSRQRHLLDLAAAHAAVGNRPEATGILTGLRVSAPQWLRHQRAGRATARKLLDSPARTLSAEARDLADFYDFDA